MSARRLAPALLALVASGCDGRGSPDWWAAVPPRELLTTPAPAPVDAYNGLDNLGVGVGIAGPLDWALSRVDAISSASDPVMVDGALEWRTRPGLAEAVQWRLSVRNVGGLWTTETGFRPAQSWTYRLEVKAKLEPDAAFLVVLDGTRETPEGGPQSFGGAGSARATWVEPCKLLGAWCSPQLRGRSAFVSYRLDVEGRHVEAEGREESTGGETVRTLEGFAGHDGSGWATREGVSRSGPGLARPVTSTESARFEWRSDASGCGSTFSRWLDAQAAPQESSHAWCWNTYLQDVRE